MQTVPGERIAVVTGAVGFIGRSVCEVLLRRGWQVRGAVRSTGRAGDVPVGVTPVTWDLEHDEVPAALLRNAQAVLHCAGRAHRLSATRDHAAYWRVNVDGTRTLLHAAREHGVGRFVYVSSVKVLGEGEGSPYGPDAPLAPCDAYASSKAAAEDLVRRESGPVRWTIVRPAFVYGASGRGNFVRLLKLARLASRVPLPLGGIRNRRSIVYVENLADLLVFCAESEAAAGRIVPGVDTQSVSTPALLRAVGTALNLTPRLYPAPARALSLVARILGRSDDWHRLSSDFEVETAVLRELGWRPAFSFDESFRRCAAGSQPSGVQ